MNWSSLAATIKAHVSWQNTNTDWCLSLQIYTVTPTHSNCWWQSLLRFVFVGRNSCISRVGNFYCFDSWWIRLSPSLTVSFRLYHINFLALFNFEIKQWPVCKRSCLITLNDLTDLKAIFLLSQHFQSELHFLSIVFNLVFWWFKTLLPTVICSCQRQFNYKCQIVSHWKRNLAHFATVYWHSGKSFSFCDGKKLMCIQRF